MKTKITDVEYGFIAFVSLAAFVFIGSAVAALLLH